VARYLAFHARSLTVATLGRRLVAIRRAHTLEGRQDPTSSPLVRQTFRGLRRAYGRPQRRVEALTAEQLAAIVSLLGQSVRDVRDRALLLVGFAGAFRRSELVAIDAGAIQWTSQGVLISLYRSKTDQEGRGRKVGIPYAPAPICPVAALRCWLDACGVADGPVFRPLTKAGQVLTGPLSGDAVAAIVKQRVRAVGLDPAIYSGHSLRVGFATSAAVAGVPMWRIKAQTGHASDAVLSRYIRLAHAVSSHLAGCFEAGSGPA